MLTADIGFVLDKAKPKGPLCEMVGASATAYRLPELVNGGSSVLFCSVWSSSPSESVSCEWLQPIVGPGENKGEPWKMADDGAIVVCHSQRPAHHQSGGTIHQDDRRPDRLLSHRTLHHSSPFVWCTARQSHIYTIHSSSTKAHHC